MIIRFSFRVEERALFLSDEHGLRISAWNTEYRGDTGTTQDVVIKDLKDETKRYVMQMQLPLGVPVWPVDARIHFEASVFAESADGPAVGEPGGTGSLTFRELKEYVAMKPGYSIRVPLQQIGVKGPKMVIVIDGLDAKDNDRVESWIFADNATRDSLTPASVPYHNDVLKKWAYKNMWKFTREAASRGVKLEGAVTAVRGLHLPIARLNVPVPHPMYWMLNGDIPFGDEANALEVVFSNLLDMALRRMNWTYLGRQGFIKVIKDQTTLQSVDPAYNEEFTDACAIMAHVCSIVSTQFYYKPDEVHIGNGRTRDVELFFDAMHMAGGDCEDTGSLIARTFLWLRSGNADLKAPSSRRAYHRETGGWRNPGVDALQRLCYWYAAVGCIGSVTAARVAPGAGGEAPEIIINSQTDRELPVGGHAYTTFVPIVRLEELIARMNPTTFGSGAPKLRPNVPGKRYPAWAKKLPTMIGEGTGDLYPLALPPDAYYYSPSIRRDKMDMHRRIGNAFKLLRATKVLRRLQVQRHSAYDETKAGMRIGSFYRRATHGYCVDMPSFGGTFVMKGPRTSEQRIGAIPGDPGPTEYPRMGVNQRDILLAANDGAYGDGNPEVAIALNPPLELTEITSFRTRCKQLRPWSMPRVTATEREKLAAEFAPLIQEFEQMAQQTAVRPRDVADDLDVVLALRFRRNEFALNNARAAALVELKRLRTYIVKISVHFEYPADNAYGVCVMVHMIPPDDDGDGDDGRAIPSGKDEEED